LAGISKPYLLAAGRPVQLVLLLVTLGQAVAPVLLRRFAGWSLLKGR
jgi:hypothetical protein